MTQNQRFVRRLYIAATRKMTYERATRICNESIKIGKLLNLKFDERFPPKSEDIKRAYNKLIQENEELKNKIALYNSIDNIYKPE